MVQFVAEIYISTVLRCQLRFRFGLVLWEDRNWIGIRMEIRSVPDPNPPDPHVIGPPGSVSTSQRYGSGSFYQQAKIVRKNSDSYCFVTSFGLFIFEK